MSISDKELQDAFRRSQQIQKQNDTSSDKVSARIRANVLAHHKAKGRENEKERMFALVSSHIRAYFASSTLPMHLLFSIYYILADIITIFAVLGRFAHISN